MKEIIGSGRRRLRPAAAALGALELALAAAGDGACVVGADGRIVRWNRAAERILGYPARDILGRPCCDVFVGHDDRAETVEAFDMKTRSKAGHPVWLNVSILRMADAGPAGPVTVHLFRDVTANKELLALVHERLAATAEREAGHDPTAVLSRRELEVLRLLALGLNTKTAAERLHVSPATVRNHVQNLFAKLGVHSRLEAVAHATRHRLL